MFYSGHKRLHGMVFQAITTPDGLTSSLFGPFIGRTNDWGMFNASEIPYRLHRMMPASNKMLYLYSDPASHCSYSVICPFGPRKQLSRRKRRFNKELSATGSQWNTRSVRFFGNGRRSHLSRGWRLVTRRQQHSFWWQHC
jgi:hypothetical protein